MHDAVSVILFLQIPILICIVAICILLDRVHYIRNLNIIAVAWIFNLLYVIATIFLRHGTKSSFIIGASNLFDLVCSLMFFIAIYKSANISLPNFVKGTPLFLFILICIGAWLSKSVSFTSYVNTIPFIKVSYVPSVFINIGGIVSLAFFFKSIERSCKVVPLLFVSLILYAAIQPFALLEDPYIDIAIPFFIGFVSKTLVLIALGNLSFAIITSLNNADVNLALEKSFSEKLNLILGRTFHEITPPLLEIEKISGELTDTEHSNSEFPVNKKVRQEVQKIEYAVHRMRTILTASIRLYKKGMNASRLSTVSELPLPIENETDINNLNTLIQIAIVNFQSLILTDSEFNHFEDNKFKVHTEYGGNCNMYCNSVEIVQVFLNLIKNSFEATPNGTCRIFIKTKQQTKRINEDEFERTIKVVYEDNGTGITSDVLPRIFDQGFSTKESTGRGFGLSIIKSHVENNSGAIEVESPTLNPHFQLTEAEVGTRFTITFLQS